MLNNCPICNSYANYVYRHPDSSNKKEYAAICMNKSCLLHQIDYNNSNLWYDSIGEAEFNWNFLLTDFSSDGYHSFGELYHHRTILFASLINVLSKIYPENCFKSKQHYEGDMYEGYFIAGVLTSEGWVTYHQELKYWNNFHCIELDSAPIWDGHTPTDAISRLEKEFAHE